MLGLHSSQVPAGPPSRGLHLRKDPIRVQPDPEVVQGLSAVGALIPQSHYMLSPAGTAHLLPCPQRRGNTDRGSELRTLPNHGPPCGTCPRFAVVGSPILPPPSVLPALEAALPCPACPKMHLPPALLLPLRVLRTDSCSDYGGNPPFSLHSLPALLPQGSLPAASASAGTLALPVRPRGPSPGKGKNPFGVSLCFPLPRSPVASLGPRSDPYPHPSYLPPLHIPLLAARSARRVPEAGAHFLAWSCLGRC